MSSASVSVASGIAAPTSVPAAAFSSTSRDAVAGSNAGAAFVSVVAEALADHAPAPAVLVARTR